MGRTVAELEETLTARELEEWIEFSGREPFGSRRENIHFAMLCTLLANINRGKQAAFKLDDFMLKDPEEIRAAKQGNFLAFLRAVSQPKR